MIIYSLKVNDLQSMVSPDIKDIRKRIAEVNKQWEDGQEYGSSGWTGKPKPSFNITTSNSKGKS